LGPSLDFCYASCAPLATYSLAAVQGGSPVLRTIVLIFGTLALPLQWNVQAQEFSADIVNLKQSQPMTAKVYVSKDRMRFEGMDPSRAMGPTALIFDEAQNKRVILLAQRHMYMDLPIAMTPPAALQIVRVSDVNDACSQWRKAAEQLKTSGKFGTCSKIGGESVNGRDAIKYQASSTDGETNYAWIDTKLHYVVKWETPGKGVEMRNIQEGTQPASLFEIPADYSKFDMGGMMQKQPH
jgi:hypothetical protein